MVHCIIEKSKASWRVFMIEMAKSRQQMKNIIVIIAHMY
jgi:hypothetical protein